VQSDRFLEPFAGFQKVKQAVEKVRPDFLDSLGPMPGWHRPFSIRRQTSRGFPGCNENGAADRRAFS